MCCRENLLEEVLLDMKVIAKKRFVGLSPPYGESCLRVEWPNEVRGRCGGGGVGKSERCVRESGGWCGLSYFASSKHCFCFCRICSTIWMM